jgi:hypothetical protein
MVTQSAEFNGLFAIIVLSSLFYNPYAMRSRIMYIESKAEGLADPLG